MKSYLNMKAESEKIRQQALLLSNKDLQILDIKHMAEFEQVYRHRARCAIGLFKDWKNAFARETDSIELLYGSIEGILLRRQAEDAIRLYWIIRQDFRKVFRMYLEKNTIQKKFSNQAA